MTYLATVPTPRGFAAGLPVERGGWWHEFVCPAHGTELLPDGVPGPVPPEGGCRCPHGCRVDTPAVRGAWLVLSHQAWARRIRVLAHRAERLGDRAARAEAVELLAGYAEVYRDLTHDGENAQAQEWMLRGRLFQQALTDAIWTTSIAHAVWSLAASGRPGDLEDLAPVLPLLEETAAAARLSRERLVADGKFTSNYTAWLNSAGLVCARAAALVRGAEFTDVDGWVAGEHGLLAHVLAGSTGSGWEWEASSYYHSFVVRAYLLGLRGTDPSALPAPVRDRLRAMVGVLPLLATDGGFLPAVHDGPYVRAPYALELLELAALADGFCTDAGYGAITTRARLDAGDQLDDLDTEVRAASWFPGRIRDVPAVPRALTVFEDVGLVVLRGAGLHAVLDLGPHGGSHGHHDKLSLAVHGHDAAFQPDPGQVPYGHGPWRAHYASAAAHPTLTVDGREPWEGSGRMLARTDGSVTAYVHGTAEEWYEGVDAVRHVELADGYLLDIVRAVSSRPRTLSLGLRPDVPLEAVLDGPLLRTRWGGGQMTGTHLLPVGAVPVSRPGPGPADDPQRTRLHVDLAGESADDVATWVSVFQTAGSSPVRELFLDGDRLTIVTASGTRSAHDLPEVPRD